VVLKAINIPWRDMKEIPLTEQKALSRSREVFIFFWIGQRKFYAARLAITDKENL
jgi:hypothetical protein